VYKQWSGFVREMATDADNFGVSCKSALSSAVAFKAYPVGPPQAYVLPVFLIYFLFKRFLSKCLKICETDLYPICRNGRTVAVDERTEVKFFDPSRDAALATICVGFIGFYPQNWVRVTFGRRRLTTRSTGKPIS